MRYYRSRFYSALQLFQNYEYPEPFHVTAKNYFKSSKKFGSKDRKAISELCYTYLRTGLMFKDISIQEGLLLSGLYLEWDDLSDWNKLSTELQYTHEVDLRSQKMYLVQLGYKPKYYPDEFLMPEFNEHLSPRNISFRPKNWAKDHTDTESRYLGLIGTKEISHNAILEDTIQVQDLSSQFICSKIEVTRKDKVWDVCSGAGGKTLNLSSRGEGKFYLSDIRPQILSNAKNRLNAMHYEGFYATVDLATKKSSIDFGDETISYDSFDIIIADVPCSGSGTWFRTPEHFTRFDYSSLESYINRQKSIVKNAFPFLKSGGKFYYLTCSIFEEENSQIKNWMLEKFDVELKDEIAFNGIEHRSDAMYMASFIKK